MATNKLGVMNMALTLLGDHRLATETDDVEARYALDSSWDRAVAFVFQAAYWRFALKTATLTHNGALTALAGYSSTFASPATYFRPHAIFVLSGARECPIDVRQQGTQFHANVTPIYLRYVDNALIATVASWPESFAKAVAAYLAFVVSSRVSQDPQAPNAMFGIWQQYFGAAETIEAVPPDPWLPHQLSGDFLPSCRYILEQGFWHFALKSATMTNSVGVILPNFTYGFDRPADWLKTQSLFVQSGVKELPFDIREHGARWSANITTFKVRYLSNAGLDSTLWPDEFRAVVAAYLAAKDPVTDEQGRTSSPAWVEMAQAALANIAIVESPWLNHQVSGRFVTVVRAMLEEGYWRFAVKTVEIAAIAGTPSSGYTYSFTRPADWLRTFEVYETANRDGNGIDFRDEGGQYHANYTPITVRYLSTTLGYDATNWTALFEEAALAGMQLRRAVETPGTPGAVLQSLSAIAEKAGKLARSKDDTRERPRVNAPSRFVQGRYGAGWGFNSREQG